MDLNRKPLALAIALAACFASPAQAQDCQLQATTVFEQALACQFLSFESVGANGRNGDPGRPGEAGQSLILRFNNDFTLTRDGAMQGLSLISEGGRGGNGSRDTEFDTARGGPGGDGGSIFVVSNLGRLDLRTILNSPVILLQSLGGVGGNGTAGSTSIGGPSSGGSAGNGGQINLLLNNAIIQSVGNDSYGILLQSIGGGGGRGGGGSIIGNSGGTGAEGGNGGAVVGRFLGLDVLTLGEGASAILAQSLAGGGGAGGGADGIVGLGGNGGGGGAAGRVSIDFNGSAVTRGRAAPAIQLHSVAGGGGNAGSATGPVAIGGSGAGGGVGGSVAAEIDGSIQTLGIQSQGLFAMSVGGGGGNGGSSTGPVSIGGSGAAAADGGEVGLIQRGSVQTQGDFSRGIELMSVGGGGGTGGTANATGPATLAVGGNGAGGGAGGAVSATLESRSSVQTQGIGATAVQVKSVGGGGGSGGGAYSAAVTTGQTPSAAVSIGGRAGTGGNSGAVTARLNAGSQISTARDDSLGLVAQSLGGGGGVGGTALSGAAAASSFSAAVALGGAGGAGGDGGQVQVTHNSQIQTQGHSSTGVLAQSVGGGGGRGGASIALSASTTAAAAVSLGGTGGGGGDGAATTYTQNGSITTVGDTARGVVVQSVGGGGGDGGFALAGAVTAGPVSNVSAGVALGGTGGMGGTGAAATASLGAQARIQTQGALSTGLLVQSVGGGGGTGGGSLSGTVALSGTGTASVASSVSLGGRGNKGNTGGAVTVNDDGALVTTRGAEAHAIHAQSLGGGGGAGGLALGAGVSTRISLGASVGGNGIEGGTGGAVVVNTSGNQRTQGDNSAGVLAQSIGGGGGAGGLSGGVQATVAGGQGLSAFSSVGGLGGSGNSGGAVTVQHAGTVATAGVASQGIRAESVGGGGGQGGHALSASFSASGSGPANFVGNVSIGGGGGIGGTGGAVTVQQSGTIQTQGRLADGVAALSLGGGGGDGGAALTLGAQSALNARSYSANVGIAVGGDGGQGNIGGQVTVSTQNTSRVETQGDGARAVVAESIGGGGGRGGTAGAATVSLESRVNSSIAVGGRGGSGDNGGLVTVTTQGQLGTQGNEASAVYAQSVGGGGGTGGQSMAINLAANPVPSNQSRIVTSLSLGGSGGTGGQGSQVQVQQRAAVTTRGQFSHGVFAQSVGGGGGRAGNALALLAEIAARDSKTINTSSAVGGRGGQGGTGGQVTVENAGTVRTTGAVSHGILAQSVGGGGGDGGAADQLVASITPRLPGDENRIARGGITTATVTVGGAGVQGGTAGTVTVTNTGSVVTEGDRSRAIYAQSVGGGGGIGGSSNRLTLEAVGVSLPSDNLKDRVGIADASIQVGGSGGSSGDGGNVTVQHAGGVLATRGNQAHAILAQSVGGGGGEAFVSAQVDVQTNPTSPEAAGSGGTIRNSNAARLAFGGSGGAAGDGGTVTVSVTDAQIQTEGAEAFGVLAQSVGGGGGIAGGIETRTIGQPTPSTVPVPESLLPVQNQFNAVVTGAQQLSNQLGVNLLGDGGNAGNGGTVSVTLADTTRMRLTGDNSVGVFAQSVGGGGGRAGSFVTDASKLGGVAGQAIDVMSFNGSVGGSGLAGSVSVENRGVIEVTGQGAIGIFAQRSDSGVIANNRSITVDTGTVRATGVNGQAVRVANTSSSTSLAPIQVNVPVGAEVVGGLKDSAAPSDRLNQAAAIQVDEGNLQLFNRGRITTMSGAAGDAIVLNGSGSLSIENQGEIIGSIRQRSSTEKQLTNTARITQAQADTRQATTFTNHQQALLSLGDNIDLAGGQLVNQGQTVLSQAQTFLNGSFQQGQNATLTPEIRLAQNQVSEFRIGGAATLSGVLAPTWSDRTQAPIPTNVVLPLITPTGLTLNNLSFRPDAPPMTQFRLIESSTGLQLGITTSYALPAASLSETSRSVGVALDQILSQPQFSANTNRLASAIANLPDAAAIAEAYEGLAPDEQTLQTQSALTGALDFRSQLMSCFAPEAAIQFSSQYGCLWLRSGVKSQEGQTSGNQAGLDEEVVHYAIGGQRVFEPGWVVGAAVSQARVRGSLAGNVQRNGHVDQVGLVVKHIEGQKTWSIATAYLSGTFGQRRQVFTGAVAESEPRFDGFQVSSRFQYHQPIPWGYVAPFAEFGATFLSFNEVRETGAMDANLIVDARRSQLLDTSLGFELGTELRWGKSLWRPFAQLAYTTIGGDRDASIRARFAADESVGFESTAGMDQHFLRASIGAHWFFTPWSSLRLEVHRERGKQIDTTGWQLRLAVPWR